MKSSLNIRWLLKMAWRDSRRSRSRLMLFTSSIILGVAALVAINSFKESLQRDINDQAKDLLGADLVIYSNQPITDSVMVMMDTLGGDHSFETSFASMIFFPKNQGSRLVNVRALKGNFPYYGSIETTPESANLSFRQQQKALVDKTIMLQFEAENGDSVKIGNLSFLIEGALKKLPGQSGIAATVSPPVYIPLKYLDKTGLVQKGSRITYRHYFKFDPDTDVGALVKSLEPVLEKEGLRHETVDMRKESIGRTFENLASFLNLVGFVALLLGCVGVASSVHIYVKEKLASVAILRCIGAKGSQAFLIYLVQILGMGLLGSFIGTALGSSIQTILPQLFMDFLPLEVNTYISWKAIVQGFLIGTAVSLLFALYPLINIRRTSPLRTLRAEYEEKRESMDLLKWLIG
ncbi:MAG: ABC transporter permease, partial [Bacteroidetes bacterium]|nr:ABC transporter permease [Bacteroidota bacterium]